MRLLALITLILFLVVPAKAQDTSQDDRGYLQALLEDNLSGAGRDIRIKGFKGALSSNASIEELTIADETGVWITLKGVALEWTRSALLSGELDVDRLSASEILLLRLPDSDASLSPEDAQATEFSLPDLPVSIRIGEISADRVFIGEPVFGAEAEFTLTGNMTLGGGEGRSKLEIARTDAIGALNLEADYSNTTNILALDLNLQEGADGIAANLLDLPGRPALDLQIKGEDPLTDYLANIALSSAGEPRLQGTVTIRETDEAAAPGQLFSADLEGDLAPLFAPEYQPFFGDRSRLSLDGLRQETGALEISDLSLVSAALALSGQLELNAQGWPTRFQLNGELGDGTRTRLPVSGPGTWVEKARITAGFDADQNNQWQADINFDTLERDVFTIRRGTLSARGTISDTAPQSVLADLEYALDGFDHADAKLARALGQELTGTTNLQWQAGTPLELNTFDIQAGDVRLSGTATLDGLTEGFPVAGNVHIVTGDLSRFALIAGRDLAGRADARISGDGTLLGGAFDIDLSARTTDLSTGTPRLDPLLRGKSELQLAAKRDTSGTNLQRLVLLNDALSLVASGQIDASRGQLSLSGRLADVSLVEPKVSGPATFDTNLDWQDGGDVVLNALKLTVADATLNATGSLSPDLPGLPARGQLSATINDLSHFAALSGQKLAGRLDLTLDGTGTLQGQDFQVSAGMDGSGLRTGIPTLDQLIGNDLTFATDAGRQGQQINIRSLSLKTSQVQLTAEGAENGTAPLQISARLANLGLLAPGFNGPLRAAGLVRNLGPDARDIELDLTADGPGGTTAKISGSVFDYGQRVDLALSGTAPMALANSFISPRSVQGTATYDLQLTGRPALGALSGSVRTGDGRLALPALNVAVQNVTGTVTMASNRAQIDVSGQLRDGGTVTVSGPVGLNAPFSGDIRANLSNAVLTDNLVYTTSVTGSVAIAGPLTGGALIGGDLTLGETEIRIPSSGSAASVTLPDIRHVNEPPAVAATRFRAGLINPSDGTSAKPFPLNLSINAPRRIFVRGRGLDAELGGRLRLSGTTNNVAPSGFFQLIRGRLDILGKRLDLTEGLIDMRGALDPYLRFVAETQAEDVTVQIIIEGLASAPEITFQSQPELPQEEVVSRLLFGRGLDTVSPFQAAQLASAVATLAGRNNNDIVGRLRDTVGLSDLDVTSTEEGATEVRAGAYISKNVYSEVTVDSEGRQEINLNLDINSRLTVKGGLDNEGGTGLGIFFEKDY